jgi:hypothetical protein
MLVEDDDLNRNCSHSVAITEESCAAESGFDVIVIDCHFISIVDDSITIFDEGDVFLDDCLFHV